MNYLRYFKFKSEPFGPSIAQRDYFASDAQTRVVQKLLWAAEGMRGLAVVAGQVGYGKTTIAQRLTTLLPTSRFRTIMVVMIHAGVEPQWLLAHIAQSLGVADIGTNKLELVGSIHRQLTRFHAEGRKVVLLLDEAQMLSGLAMMEELRGLLNLESPGRKLLSMILFGLPELFENLQLDKPLLQRIALRCELQPFSQEETRSYIEHRLSLAGATRPIFSQSATRTIHQATGGVPRLINVVADNTLLEMFFSRESCPSQALLESVCANLGLDIPKDESTEHGEYFNERDLGFCPDEIAASVAREPVKPENSEFKGEQGRTVGKEIRDPLAFLAGPIEKDATRDE